jgi:hypothetical protein
MTELLVCTFCMDGCLDVAGRGGELLTCLFGPSGFLPSETSRLSAVELPKDCRRRPKYGESGKEPDRARSGCLYLGLALGHGRPGVDGVVGT